jgi:hypothetical protein
MTAAEVITPLHGNTQTDNSSVLPYFDSRRAKVELPGSGRLLSDFATDLGKALSTADIFSRGGLVFIVSERGDKLEQITPDVFRSWCESHVVCFHNRKVMDGGAVIEFKKTMSSGDAAGVLSSQQFSAQLQKIQRVNPVRMPVMNRYGEIKFLADGFDEDTEIFTAPSGITIPDKLPLEFCKPVLDDLLREFPFADSGRSKAVAIAAMLTVYGAGLLPRKSLRPCFVFLANAEGAGKTLLVKVCTVPVFGFSSTTSKPKDEDEMRKVLLTAIIEGRHVLCFDNFKGRLASESLEGFLTSQDWQGRILGGSKTFTGGNNYPVTMIFCVQKGHVGVTSSVHNAPLPFSRQLLATLPTARRDGRKKVLSLALRRRVKRSYVFAREWQRP